MASTADLSASLCEDKKIIEQQERARAATIKIKNGFALRRERLKKLEEKTESVEEE